MQVGITPTHGNLNRVMTQEQSPPDHWANATQNHLELVNVERLGARHRSPIVSPRTRLPKVFLNSVDEDLRLIAETVNAASVRNHLHWVVELAEAALGDEKVSFIEGCPGEWAACNIPSLR
jgi:hypothetical protein